MSLSSNVLQFRLSRSSDAMPLSAEAAERAARDFLSIPIGNRSDEDRDRSLGNSDIVMGICGLLGKWKDSAPSVVAAEAADAYRWISQPDCNLGLFDERDYFLGQAALLAGIATRHLGRREEAFLWLDRAEAGFRHTLNPAPGLANVAYARLALRFEMGRYQDVLELTPSLEASFRKLRMGTEAAKCRLLLAMALKQTGQNPQALDALAGLEEQVSAIGDRALQARILAEVGDLHQLEGQLDLAVFALRKALNILQSHDRSAARADLQLFVGGVLRAKGALGEAEAAFREARSEYLALEMRPQTAYMSLVIAEVLIVLGREREAEWEIRTALPAIDEIRMVPEAIAAVALLRESASRKKTDLSALRELRTRLKTTN
jgi:tetratricopeptide (TPR) repeat protein